MRHIWIDTDFRLHIVLLAGHLEEQGSDDYMPKDSSGKAVFVFVWFCFHSVGKKLESIATWKRT